MRILTLALLVLMIGCGDIKHSNSGIGTVRNVWDRTCYDVTFERDDGLIVVYDFVNKPAVWQGMRGTIEYDFDTSGMKICAYTAGSVWRSY